MTKADISANQGRARSVIENITKDHGYLAEEIYAKMDTKARHQIQDVLLKKNDRGQHHNNMREGQFIFELLKNANDNNFSRAETMGDVPYISFDVYTDRIIIECNEDGFNEADIRTISNTCRSTKTGAQGIGFKSVFQVAYKAHIRSGHYSFTFTHLKDDSGMGMITPEWAEADQGLPAPLTRTTLYLHNAGSERSQRRRFPRHFRRLDSSILLSLTNLERIEVRIHNENSSGASLTMPPMKRRDQLDVPVALEKVYTRDGDTACTKQKKHIATGSTESDSDGEDTDSGEETASTVHFSLHPFTPRDTTTNDIRRRLPAIREYRALLSQITSQAPYCRALQDPACITKSERDKRVEAAGQLFVFNPLACVCSGFNDRNWTSAIRKYVTIHPDHAEMVVWTGVETSDFQYKDAYGDLTEALVDKGQLPKKWLKRCPKYYIKVKTTPGAWDEPFFIESAEYLKMKKLSTDESVYIIFRVFDLFSGEIDVKLYINPVNLSEEGSMKFMIDRRIVKP
ncbi:hypothetical protein F5Y06DRAFT_299063 [Hypoxylon sp. FL0890]|nr:hypothetical protein F5Y06DRAFT_299063 [Hypoxylon sp. FL0890]